MSKVDFFNELMLTPDTVKQAVIGTVADVAMPQTAEQALLCSAKVLYNINQAVLKPLQGLDIAELVLRSGQRNSSLVSLLLTGLETITGVGGKLSITSPQEGYVYQAWFDSGFSCVAPGALFVLVSCDGQEYSLSEDGAGMWHCGLSVPLSVGKHQATFSSRYPDGFDAIGVVSFEICNIETVPTASQHYFPYDLLQVVVSGESLVSGKASIFDQALDLYLDGAGDLVSNIPLSFEVMSNSYSGAQKMALAVRTAAGGVFDTVVDFFIDRLPEE